MKRKVFEMSLFIIMVIGFWNLFEFLYCKFITNSAFSFEVGTSILLPLVTAVVVGYFIIIRKSK